MTLPVMHIAFVVANYPPHTGGVERHVATLASVLQRRGIRVSVFNVEPRGGRFQEGVRVVGLGRHLEVGGVAALPSADALRVVPRALRNESVTHVSVHTRFFPATWLGLLSGRRVGLPVTLTEHGGGPVASGGDLLRVATRGIDRTAGTWAFRRAGALLAVSERSADFVEELSGRRPLVCGNGIDVRWWAPEGPVASRRKLVFVGRLVQEKGWRAFLDILDELPTDVSGVVLGSGPDEKAAAAEVARRGLEGRVAFLGEADPGRVREELRGAVYVNPSTAAEGLQTTLLEAACAGARVATYDVGGAAEVRTAGAAIEVVQPGDIRGLGRGIGALMHRDWRAAPGLWEYEWSRVADHYVDVWRSM